MDTRAAALELGAIITDTLDTLDPAPVVTIHTDDALNAAASGLHAVLVTPPRVEFDTTHHATATWTLMVVPGSADRDTSWTEADQLLGLIRDALDIDQAQPHDWQPDTGGIPLLAYQLTLTTDHDL